MQTFCTIFLLCLCFLFAQEAHITILHTSDQHGYFMPFKEYGQSELIGGLPAKTTLFAQVRDEVAQKSGNLLILDVGDINTGYPFSNYSQAKPMIEMMNRIGYQAMAVGNHEFDLTLEDLLLQASSAHFPYLSANVVYSSTKKTIFKPYIILEASGIKIGVFGVTPPSTDEISTNGKDPRISFLSVLSVLPKLLEELKPQCDFIVGLFHIDHEQTLRYAELFPDIDIIIGGHTHKTMPKAKVVGKTLVAEAGWYGMVVGRWDLVFENKKLKDYKYQNIGINLTEPIYDTNKEIACDVYTKKFEQDPIILEIAKKHHDEILKKIGSKLCEASEDIPKSEILPSSPLGNLICDAIREAAKTDVALQNTGGIRSNILQGEVFEHDLQSVLPFANTVVIYTITGHQLSQILGKMVRNRVHAKGLLEVSGLTMTVDKDKITKITIANVPIDMNKTYRVAVNSFMANGGDGYSALALWKSQSEDTRKDIATVVKEYLQTNSPVRANHEQRIIWQ